MGWIEFLKLIKEITKAKPPTYHISEYYPKTYGTTIAGRGKR